MSDEAYGEHEFEKVERETRGQIAMIAAALSHSRCMQFWPPVAEPGAADPTLNECVDWYTTLARKLWDAAYE